MTRRPRIRPLSLLTLSLAAWVALASGCGSGNGIVGGDCADGYARCSNRCVLLASDPNDCGACGVVCAGTACVEGTCGGVADGAPSDGATDGEASGDGNVAEADAEGDGGASDGGAEGGAPDGALGDAAGDGATDDGTMTDATPDAAGPGDATMDDGAGGDALATDDGTTGDGTIGDGTTDDGTTSDGASGDGSADGGAPGGDSGPPLTCDAGLVVCDGACVDTTQDPGNCGTCGRVCPSQICVASACVGSTPGDVVFIGHDYATTSAGTAQARVLTNAVFLAQEPQLRVLSYERYADGPTVTRIKGLINAGLPTGRTIAITPTTTDADVTAITRQSYDVLLVPDQVNAQGDVDLGALGSEWAPALGAFTIAGGVVVVLDGASGAGQMPALVSGTGLLSVTAQSPIATGTPLTVLTQGDAIGIGVLSPYAAGTRSASITTEPPGGSVVYVVATGDAGTSPPIVVHKLF